MTHLAPVHWKRFDAFLRSIGCELVREKGDHLVYARKGLPRPIVVPKNTQIPIFIIRNNLRVLGVSHEEYIKALCQN